MTDLVERLRHRDTPSIYDEAADEIERLRDKNSRWRDLCSEQVVQLMACRGIIDERKDEITRLRAQVESLSEQLTMESITTCHCAAKSAADCGCPGAVWPEDVLRSRVAELESDLAAKAELIEMLLAEIACHMAEKRASDVPNP